jgi:hypothetical protein
VRGREGGRGGREGGEGGKDNVTHPDTCQNNIFSAFHLLLIRKRTNETNILNSLFHKKKKEVMRKHWFFASCKIFKGGSSWII